MNEQIEQEGNFKEDADRSTVIPSSSFSFILDNSIHLDESGKWVIFLIIVGL
jgi:hypothetical protein